MNAKRTTRPQNLTVYLGAGEQREKRLKDIEAIAVKLAGTTDEGKPAISKLIQMIADGELEVVQKDKQKPE
jgi:hypothetical protein